MKKLLTLLTAATIACSNITGPEPIEVHQEVLDWYQDNNRYELLEEWVTIHQGNYVLVKDYDINKDKKLDFEIAFYITGQDSVYQIEKYPFLLTHDEDKDSYPDFTYNDDNRDGVIDRKRSLR